MKGRLVASLLRSHFVSAPNRFDSQREKFATLSLVTRRFRLGHSWTLPRAVTSPRDTSRGQRIKRERLGTRLHVNHVWANSGPSKETALFNRPRASSKTGSHFSHLWYKAKCKTKISFICMRIKNYLHTNSFALSLALGQRLGTIPKWPISSFPVSSLFLAREKRSARFSLRWKRSSRTFNFSVICSHVVCNRN